MAQPVYAIKYIGAISVKGGTTYSSTTVLAQFPGATCLVMKTPDISVSVNGTDMFPIAYEDQSYIESGINYTFNKNCVIAIGVYKAVV